MKDSTKAFEQGLRRTQSHFWGRLSRTLMGKRAVEESLLDEIEEILLSADVGLKATQQIISALEARVQKDKYLGKEQLMQLLQEEMQHCLPTGAKRPPFSRSAAVQVILLVGVNGTGKTTTAARLAYGYQQQGAKVLLGAADTFRAAAIEQLQHWGQRLNIPVVAKNIGTDPSAVAYATLTEALQNHKEVVIVDTAGRLHNKQHLMDELSKLRRVMTKVIPEAPHEVLLVLDASTGQNALLQAKAFIEATQVTGLVLTKLDGTAKGGVVLGIAAQYDIPIHYVGLGEGLSDLRPFESEPYIKALFKEI